MDHGHVLILFVLLQGPSEANEAPRRLIMDTCAPIITEKSYAYMKMAG